MDGLSKSFALVLVALFLTSLVTVPFAISADAETTWTVQTVDEYAWAGGGCPIAVDSNNMVHIAYMDFPNGTNSLIYTSYDGSGWTNQTVDGSGYVFVVFSLVLDANGCPHILYNTSPLGAPIDPLKIASWNGNDWDIQNTGITYAGSATLLLDSFGNPHIAYTTGVELQYGANWIGSALDYASWTGTSWTTQTVYSNMNDSFSAFSFALDSNNIPFIMYSLASNSNNIKLASYQNSRWNTQTIPLPPSSANLGNVVVDSKDDPRFIYTEPYQNSTTFSTILYASLNGTVLSSQTVTSKVSLGYDYPIGQLVLDSHDNPRLCYINSDGVLMYAAFSGRAWNIQKIDSSSDLGPYGLGAGEPCYLALDSSGNPHISFRTASPMRYTSNLMYASETETTRTPSPPVPEFPALAILPLLLFVFSVAVIVRHRKTFE